METPNNISLLIGKGHDNIVRDVLEHLDQPEMNIIRLSKAFHIHIVFTQPVSIRLNRHKTITVKEHTFKAPFFMSGSSICYLLRKGGRKYYYLPVSNIDYYEPIPSSADQFNCYEDFKKMFDPFFIEESQILSLWNSTSAQHGEKYKPSDFKKLNKSARSALRMFLINFKGIDNTDKSFYTKRIIGNKEYYNLSGNYYGSGNSNSSRDTRISHQFGMSWVGYTSEVFGGGPNTNGIIASKSKYLWTEND
jgi:hypothetical protein